MNRKKVTVYITSHNYGRFLAQAIESVIAQTLCSWELWIVDDGSTDNTEQIARKYVAGNENLHFIRHSVPVGLRSSANEVLQSACGEYVIRLDADDYFDENALLVLAAFLDGNESVGLVYPNWIYVGENGEVLGVEQRKKVGVEAKVLDLPAHGACTMVRRRILKSVGGYDVQHDSQDGHELWIKVLHRFGVANVSTPLFYYRQHSESMSRDQRKMLESRQKIKRVLAARLEGAVRPRSVAVVPAKNSYRDLPGIVLQNVGGKPLIDHTLDAAVESRLFEKIYVYTDDDDVVDHCSGKEGVLAEVRDPDLSGPRSRLSEIVSSAVSRLEMAHQIFPDIVVALSVHSPLRTHEHIQKAVDTLLLYDVENVVSTCEDIELHFVHGENGLVPLNPGMISKLRYERESLYVGNGAVHAMWRDFVSCEDLYKGRLGHIVMPREFNYQIKAMADLPIVELAMQLHLLKEL
ncbi:Putative glycosyltransferase EpsE [Roseimaritima multifibrata]|uniref:Glycosyltransferase EpsE n=1 Tax=Roseimaritima multifibrata TaxID=1930274 RepID=A0A517MNJ4_9BACT|nr:glycosyltransferase [Roseimaritima multifibrata]QDS96357.1 Putative glycosyltransferase EpsE [Roseimaritima multifibrata]